jgi:hypothetical protein
MFFSSLSIFEKQKSPSSFTSSSFISFVIKAHQYTIKLEYTIDTSNREFNEDSPHLLLAISKRSRERLALQKTKETPSEGPRDLLTARQHRGAFASSDSLLGDDATSERRCGREDQKAKKTSSSFRD